eukprot:CAMPEP_0172164456 /NCGR_PEP_ID=MMETSP1050-20130122/7853_1 /TAXON_ID=233186 /ORGANISM="Cryptomonas curvata, Strain CCAP979/52" /LENGTH=222 /DNA_ID=CAMNT_0012834791 /DNA_START=110 /DNA_END=775 /DNA_ORIENTATION=-
MISTEKIPNSILDGDTVQLDIVYDISMILRTNCRWRCTTAGDSLDRYMTTELDKLSQKARSGSSVVAFLLFPFAFICQRRWFLLILLALSGYQIHSAISSAVEISVSSVRSFQHYRLLSVMSADGRAPLTSLTLLRHGCDIPTEPDTSSQSVANASGWGYTLLLSFPSLQEMDGFRLTLSTNRSNLRFLLQGRADGAHEWADIGAPQFRRLREGVRLLGGEL